MTRTACVGRCLPKLLNCSPSTSSATSPMKSVADLPKQIIGARTAMKFRLGKWVKFMNDEPTP